MPSRPDNRDICHVLAALLEDDAAPVAQARACACDDAPCADPPCPRAALGDDDALQAFRLDHLHHAGRLQQLLVELAPAPAPRRAA